MVVQFELPCLDEVWQSHYVTLEVMNYFLTGENVVSFSLLSHYFHSKSSGGTYSFVLSVQTLTAQTGHATSTKSNHRHSLRISLVRSKFNSDSFFIRSVTQTLSHDDVWLRASISGKVLLQSPRGLTFQVELLSILHILIIFPSYFFSLRPYNKLIHFLIWATLKKYSKLV